MNKININAETVKVKAQEVLNDVMDIMGFSLLRNQLEKVVEGNSVKEIASNIQALAEKRRTLYAHVADDGGYAEAIQLVRAEGIIPGTFAVGAATVGAAKRGASTAIGLADALFEHREGEKKVIGLIRSFYFSVRDVAETVLRKGIDVAKILLKAVWEAVKHIVAFLLKLGKNIVNKVRSSRLGDSLVGGFDDDEEDFNDFYDIDDVDSEALEEGVSLVNDGFTTFVNG